MSFRQEIERYVSRSDRVYATSLRVRRRMAPVRRAVRAAVAQPRRTVHAYCIGPPRTATTSVAGVFASVLRTAHEPYAHEFAAAVVEGLARERDDERLVEFLVSLDASMRLDLEASHLLAPVAHLLPLLFPDARFVIPLRDAYSWLESQLDHELALRRRSRNSFWFEVLDLYYRSGGWSHGPGEHHLAELGLAPLDGYLSFWAGTYRRLLEEIPEERRMLVRTDELDGTLPGLAAFLGVVGSSAPQPCHLNVRPRKDFTIARLDPAMVDEKVDQHGRELMDRFYPELRSVRDLPSAG